MPVTVELIYQGGVALQTYSDPLEMAHLDALKSKMDQEILSGASGKVHIIADFRQVHNLPGMILTRGSRMLNNAHPNTGLIVAIIAHPLVYRMAHVFASLIARGSFKVASTFEEAVQIINAPVTTALSAKHQEH